MDKDAVTFTLSIAGCVVGVSGLCLGIYNLRRAITKDKIAIVVTTKNYVGVCGERGIMIEAVNTGFRPVTIEGLGFYLRDGRLFYATQLHELDGGALPKELAPQSRVRLHFNPGAELSAEFRTATRCFARTSTGEKFFGEVRLHEDDVTIYRRA